MKALAVLLLASLPIPQISLPLRSSQPQPKFAAQVQTTARKGGKWYFARTGHAVYCYGPVRYLPEGVAGLKRVATFCRGDQPIVPLKD